ncbi:hypothetical protein ACLMJK_000268 [Lecanora helva]
MHFRHRISSTVADRQLSGPAINGAKSKNDSSETKLREDPTSLPAPAYSLGDPNVISSQKPAESCPTSGNHHPISEISTSDTPRPISEMASMDPTDFPVQLDRTGFIPYNPTQDTELSSGNGATGSVHSCGDGENGVGEKAV